MPVSLPSRISHPAIPACLAIHVVSSISSWAHVGQFLPPITDIMSFFFLEKKRVDRSTRDLHRQHPHLLLESSQSSLLWLLKIGDTEWREPNIHLTFTSNPLCLRTYTDMCKDVPSAPSPRYHGTYLRVKFSHCPFLERSHLSHLGANWAEYPGDWSLPEVILPQSTAQLEPLHPVGRVCSKLPLSIHHQSNNIPMHSQFPACPVSLVRRAIGGFSCQTLIPGEREGMGRSTCVVITGD